jgi:raffinose/stachyose/melibiose transport system permease protein
MSRAEVSPPSDAVARAHRARPATGVPVIFIVPALVLYVFVVVYPSISGITYAFTDWNGLTATRGFVGFRNFRELLGDDAARAALGNTFRLALGVMVVQNAAGLLLALGTHARLRSRFVLRTLFFAPAVTSTLIAAFLWQYIYDPSGRQGLNALLGSLGLGTWQQDWLGNPDLALWSVVLVVVWQYAGYSMVIFLAGLQGIPQELYEAADIDGASGARKFWHITWPLLAPALTLNLMLSLVGGLKLFDQVFAMTGGGPGYATETLSTLVYKQAFVFGHYGLGTALAFMLAIIVAAVSLIQLNLLRAREVSE